MRIALALLVLALFGVAAAHAETPPAQVRIASGAASQSLGKPASGGIVGWVASQGYVEKEFAGEKIGVVWQHLSGAGPAANEAIASGAADFAYYGDSPGLIGRAAGLPTRLVLPVQRHAGSTGLIVARNSTATSIRDLVGKRIAMHRGRPWEVNFHRLLATEKLKESDFQIFNLTDPDGQTALLSGNVDAVFGGYSIFVTEKNLGKVIWSLRDQPADWRAESDLWVREDFAKKYPETTRRVVRAFIRAAYEGTLPENRQRVLQALADGTRQPLAVMEREYAGVDLRRNIVPLFDPYFAEHYRRLLAEAVATRVVAATFDLDGWYEPKFQQSVLKELNLESWWTPEDAQGAPIVAANGASQ